MLMAFHVSSKDIPRWVWTTFEHKDNPGRCDFTGCNDSFGFSAKVLKPQQISNYLAPKQHNDKLSDSSIVFKRDRHYNAETRTEGHSKLFAYFNIANNKSSNKKGLLPTSGDAAWSNYRLKGSQVNFTDNQGRPTHLGNSITEAGFMSKSSCIGCHSRAGVALIKASGEAKSNAANFFHLGVFEPNFSEFGYQQSHHGIPNQKWFYQDNDSQSLEVLQTDFVWGFLNAKPLCTSDCD